MTPRSLPQRGRSPLRLEALEARYAPATLVNARTVSYQDADGDTVRVAFSRPFLTPAIVNSVFTFDTGSVDDSNAAKQQLQSINLIGVAGAAGTSITVAAARSPATDGDGFAHVGQVEATGLDLGIVKIDGDLGRVRSGDATTATSGLKGLAARSLGRYGTTTGAASLISTIAGRLGFLTVKSDVVRAVVDATGGPDGDIGRVTIGGSLVGGVAAFSGRITASGDIGPVAIRGSLIGGAGSDSGVLYASRELGNVTIGGSVQGGGLQSGQIFGYGIGRVTVGGNVVGGNGTNSGVIASEKRLAGVRVRGSVFGGSGPGSGRITALEAGPVMIGGDVSGGSGINSGSVNGGHGLATAKVGGSVVGGAGKSSGAIRAAYVGPVTIGGDLRGGTGSFSGSVSATGTLRRLEIGGDVRGGNAGANDLEQAGSIEARRIGSLTIRGSLIAGTDTDVNTGSFLLNGAIRVRDDIGSLLIRGSVIGNTTHSAVISARGQAEPTATSDVALGSLRVLGNVERAQILAGLGVNGADDNADAQIGSVVVGGDWIASSLAAGADAGADAMFGNADDTKLSGKDETAVYSKIGRLIVGGQALGTLTAMDHFGIVAEMIGMVTVGGTLLALQAGNGNDEFQIGVTGDFRVKEI